MTRSINLATQVTLSRLVVAVVFFVVLAQYSHRAPRPWLLDVAALLFLIGALTDILDGYLARRAGQITRLGRLLDPLVDKVLVCGAFILLSGTGFSDGSGRSVAGVQAWMVVLIVGRELLVTGLRGFSESEGKAFGAVMAGKIKMWAQCITAPVVLVLVAHEGSWGSPRWSESLRLGLIWLTVVLTALSSVQYLLGARHVLREGSRA